MHLAENFKQAYISLSTNKLRSILTMVGIIMGVFSVVAIMAISNATKAFMTNELNKMGANTIMVQANTTKEISYDDQLRIDDMNKIREGVSEIDKIAVAKVFYSSLKVQDDTRDAIISGITDEYDNFSQIDIVHGRFISKDDVDGERRVVVVPDSFAEEYFGTTDVIGEEIRLVNYYGDMMKVKIIGVLSTEGDLFASLLEGIEFPVEVVVPLTTQQSFFGDNTVDQLMMSAADGEDLKETGAKVIRLLEFIHNQENIYMATNVEEIQQSVGGILNVISMVLLVIAIITLVVGGIGIVNILLVSVTERIREIGLRKAIGAKKKDIILQFLTESIMMTAFSGTIGIILGLIVGAIISNFIKIPPIVDFKTMTIAFLGSVLLGLIFGVYPAKKAADLDPIESLRYE